MKLSEALKAFDLALFGEVETATRRHYRTLLASLPAALGDLELEAINTAAIHQWRKVTFEGSTKAGQPYSDGTKNAYLTAVKRLFNWLESEAIIATSPAKKLRPIPLGDLEPKAISLDDFLSLLAEIARKESLRDMAIVLFLLSTGCRVGGLCGLRLEDLDLQSGRAHVLEKGRKRRWVFLDSVVSHAVYVYINQERPAGKSDHVFLGQRGPLSTRGVWQMLRTHATSAGISGPVNPHSFRHGAAKIWLQAGVNLSAVSAMLGHSSIAITHTHYARWQVDELQEQHRKASPLNQLVLNSLLDQSISNESDKKLDI